MANELATTAELQSRLDWTLNSVELTVAFSALSDLSEDARYWGSSNWDSFTAPRQAKSLVLRAAARYMKNPDGYTTSRAGDETVMWSDETVSASPSFTEGEQKMLAALAGRNTSGLWSADLTAWGPISKSAPRMIDPTKPGLEGYDATGYVPAAAGLFPFYADNEGSI